MFQDRRAFLRNMIGGIAATAAIRTWPFRVYSFPTKISIASELSSLSSLQVVYYDKDAMATMKEGWYMTEDRRYQHMLALISGWRSYPKRFTTTLPGQISNGGNNDAQIEREVPNERLGKGAA